MTEAFHIVKKRYLAGQRETARLTPGALRETFLIEDLFAPAELRIYLTDMDRLAVGGVIPVEPIELPACAAFGTKYFTERREIGIVNLGDPGHVNIGDTRHSLGLHDFLYIGAGHPHVTFAPCRRSRPKFYFLSCPAHRVFPVQRIARDAAQCEWIGDAGNACRRRLSKYIYPGGVDSCQLVMGRTQLDTGSVWNTMPPHLHSSRSEVYLYTDLDDGLVVHLMGEADCTRHLLVRDGQAVLSPSWSLHCGAGTRPYSFVWGMAGDNQTFSDMEPVELHRLR